MSPPVNTGVAILTMTERFETATSPGEFLSLLVKFGQAVHKHNACYFRAFRELKTSWTPELVKSGFIMDGTHTQRIVGPGMDLLRHILSSETQVGTY